MNASAVITFLVIAFLVVVSAFPPPKGVSLAGPLNERLVEETLNVEEEENKGLRFRRVTCDLLSFSLPIGSLNHSACAAHCLSMMKGFRGGRCINGVCHCRK